MSPVSNNGLASWQNIARLTLLCLAPALACAQDLQTQALSAEELRDLQSEQGRLLVVDVRASSEYKAGHIPGAVNIPHTKMARKIDMLRAADAVVVYCFNGKRTRPAEQTLLENDIKEVYYLEGGLIAWRKQGYALKAGWGP